MRVRLHVGALCQTVEGLVGHCKDLAFILSKIGSHWRVWSGNETNP